MVREFVTRVGERAGLPSDEVSRLELAADEACTNAIRHAGGGPGGELTVRASFDAETVTVGVADAGPGFDPGAIPDEDAPRLLAARRTGGLGLRLMRSLVDELRYERHPGGTNELRLVKRRKGAPGER